MIEHDVVIIGSGQAGVPLATRLAGAGKRVLIAERGALGGTCVNTGCTPTKTMIASARAAHVARTAGRLGVRASAVEVDFPAVVARKRDVVKQWQAGVDRRIGGAKEGLTLVRGHARFVGERTLEIAGDLHRAPTIVIDVGARPVVPSIPGLDAVPWLDHRRAMDLDALPEHLVVLGGGTIGCELGQMFRRFGAKVTLVDHGAHLLAQEDDDVSAELERVFQGEGVTLELGATVARAAGTAQGVTLTLADGREIAGSHLLVAVGRRPNTDDLGCEAGGVELDTRGFVRIDGHYKTSAEGVYAVGDAAGLPQFTHVAWDDHRILFDLLLGKSTRGHDERHVPYAVFTDPQVAGVGVGEKQARAKGLAYDLGAMPFGNIARAVEADERAGIVKVLVDPKTDRVLGARVVGAEAAELVHVFIVLMQAGASARALVDCECVHPAFAEGLQSAVMKIGRFALS